MIMISSLSPSRLKGCCTAWCCARCNAADLSWIVYDILNLGQLQRYRSAANGAIQAQSVLVPLSRSPFLHLSGTAIVLPAMFSIACPLPPGRRRLLRNIP